MCIQICKHHCIINNFYISSPTSAASSLNKPKNRGTSIYLLKKLTPRTTPVSQQTYKVTTLTSNPWKERLGVVCLIQQRGALHEPGGKPTWVNPSLKKSYPARRAEPAGLLFSCKRLQTFDCKRVTCRSDSNHAKKQPGVM